jgi:predicted DNA-binding protein
MKNPTGKKLEKLVFGMFDQMVEGADKYVTKQGSTWLIFTESKKWVIEFTKDKTLWFNFNLFQGELDLIGKDCVEERDLIKNWFESRFLNKPKVEETKKRRLCPSPLVEDTIQNGVKEAHHVDVMKFFDKKMENTIKKGVKHTMSSIDDWRRPVEDTIQNGVKHTNLAIQTRSRLVEDTIENGVKETYESKSTKSISLRHAIKNGVKHVEDGDWLDQDERIDDIVENGVKETKEISNISLMSEMFKVKAKQTIRDGVKELKVWKSNRCEEHGYFELVDGIPTYTPMTQVKDVLENGVKEIQPLPARDGNRDWGLYYQRQKNLTKPHTEYVKEVIEDSYNHRGRIEGIIRNTNKDGI